MRALSSQHRHTVPARTSAHMCLCVCVRAGENEKYNATLRVCNGIIKTTKTRNEPLLLSVLHVSTHRSDQLLEHFMYIQHNCVYCTHAYGL